MSPSSEPTSLSPVSLDLRIETPENVVLTYQLAGPAQRGAAYLIDFAARWAILIAAGIVAAVTSVVLQGTSIGAFLLIEFVMQWGYHILSEFFFNGRTLGKKALGLRVIQENGQPLSWWSATLRNLARVADMLPLFLIYEGDIGLFVLLPIYGPAFVCMILTRKQQRIGDLVARTVVIQERRVRLPREPIIVEKIQPLPREELGAFVPDARTLALIDRFLGRRSVLTHQRGHALAAILAQSLARKLSFRGDPKLVQNYPMAFLARVYVTFAAQREQEQDEDADLRRRLAPIRV